MEWNSYRKYDNFIKSEQKYEKNSKLKGIKEKEKKI